MKGYHYIKRGIDIILSGMAIVSLSPLLLFLCIAIKLDTPGPILFKQKRVGIHRSFFQIYKFRTMRIDTPKDVPTHMLENPEQYITKVGKFLRKTSLDELPQIFNIFKGEMSIVGPRPALWNQDDLVAEREKYGANDVTPGLTGWAQINGRDELEIPDKARLDGEYIKHLGPWMDLKCFLGTVGSVLMHDGVVEGGTGELNKVEEETEAHKSGLVDPQKLKREIILGGAVAATALAVFWAVIHHILHKGENREKKKGNIPGVLFGLATVTELAVTIYVNKKRKVQLALEPEQTAQSSAKKETIAKDTEESEKGRRKKKILITGSGSYVGTSVEAWLRQWPEYYQVDTLDMRTQTWRTHDFSAYDVVYHVAGIAHADVGQVTEEEKKQYYRVNTDLAVETAEKAKKDGVQQFLFMSSMIVYSGCGEKKITKNTIPKPLNFYGDSKWQADQKIQALADERFKVVVLRPPMIYGKGSKGNYPQLAKLAGKLPLFPIVHNQRSMLYIENLAQFVKRMIDNEETGVFFPQNEQYINTSDLVQMIAVVKGHRLVMVPATGWIIRLMKKIPGKIGTLTGKAFGDSVYDMQMSEYKEEYRVCDWKESVRRTEG